MKIVIDTNIVLDTLAQREPFFERSHDVLRMVADGCVRGAITANTITDIYHVMRKHLEKDALRTALRGLMDLLEVRSVTRANCIAALDLPMNNYEDALLVCCAKTWQADCIVTRNKKDFLRSPVAAHTPEDFYLSCGKITRSPL